MKKQVRGISPKRAFWSLRHALTLKNCDIVKSKKMPIDKKRYPPDWEERSDRIKQRDDFTCRHCGATAEQEGVVLTCAHLDHDETNWEVKDDRLITLCAPCHLRYDAPDNAMRRAYGKNYRDNQFSLF